MQHKSDLIVEDHREVQAQTQVTGCTYVKAGGELIARGQLSGGLIIETGGSATVHGQVSRNVINHGRLVLLGQVSGRVIGTAPENSMGPDQIVGIDLEVPFRGTTTSWSEVSSPASSEWKEVPPAEADWKEAPFSGIGDWKKP